MLELNDIRPTSGLCRKTTEAICRKRYRADIVLTSYCMFLNTLSADETDPFHLQDLRVAIRSGPRLKVLSALLLPDNTMFPCHFLYVHKPKNCIKVQIIWHYRPMPVSAIILYCSIALGRYNPNSPF